MSEIKNKGYWTKSVKVATYLRLHGGLEETSVSSKVTDKNPKGLKVFYYEDGARVRELLESYKDDDGFHRTFDCFYQVKSIIYDKNKTADEAAENYGVETEGEADNGN